MAKIDLGLIRGSLWYQGTKLAGQSTTGVVFPESGISEALKGDKYQNSETNDLYDCIKGGAADTAQWAWYGNISFGDISDRPVNYTLPETIDMTQIPTSGGLLKDFIGWIFKSISSLNSAIVIYNDYISNVNSDVALQTLSAVKIGNLVSVYARITAKPGVIATINPKYKPAKDNVVVPALSSNYPYISIGSIWLYRNNNDIMFCASETTAVTFYMSVDYMVNSA